MGGKKREGKVDDLRRRAEEKTSELPDPEELSVEEVRKLVHELRVHQIELEMQNDALREAQAELLESSSRYTDLYDFAPVGYLTVDEESIILEANLTLAKQLGIERGILIGRPFANFVALSDRDRFRFHVAEIFSDREQPALEARLIGRKKGCGLFVLLESIVVEDSRGRKQCRISVTDISERKRAEEAAAIYMKKLEQSNRELQDFAFIASHDLQEPLRKVQAFGGRIRDKYAGALDDQGCDYLERMMNAIRRMSDMIQGLLDYSRVRTRELPFAAVDLTRVVREVVSDLEFIIEKTGASIDVGRLPIVEVDANQMCQLFQNLLSNALKFHRQEDTKPVVKIYAEPNGGVPDPASGNRMHRIFVEDNGIGFDEKYVDRIFILFQRLHGRSAYEGTGMGLAICRRIVERHHGAITARSKPEQGTTFIITLPEKQPVED